MQIIIIHFDLMVTRQTCMTTNHANCDKCMFSEIFMSTHLSLIVHVQPQTTLYVYVAKYNTIGYLAI